MVAIVDHFKGAVRFYTVHSGVEMFHGGIQVPFGGENMGLQLERIFKEEHLPRGDPQWTFHSVRSSFRELYDRSRDTCIRQINCLLNSKIQPKLPSLIHDMVAEDVITYPYVFDLLVNMDGTVNMRATKELYTYRDPPPAPNYLS